MSDRFKLIASVYLLFRDGDQILLLKRQNTGYEDGKYGLVAGHVDGDELLTKAAAREAKEESGVDIAPEDMVLKTVMHRKQDDERIDFFFEPTTWTGELTNMEPNKCSELTWSPIDDLPDNIIPYIKQAIISAERGIFYTEWWEE